MHDPRAHFLMTFQVLLLLLVWGGMEEKNRLSMKKFLASDCKSKEQNLKVH